MKTVKPKPKQLLSFNLRTWPKRRGQLNVDSELTAKQRKAIAFLK
jgi:hypothetical protein